VTPARPPDRRVRDGSDTGGRRQVEDTRDRGQLVLVAAAVLAVALAPVVLAHLQFGYHDDVRASEALVEPTENAERVLSRAVHRATVGIPADHDWDERAAAVAVVRSRLAPRIDALATSRVEDGTAYAVSYNRSVADRMARSRCPGGAGRRFGDCTAIDGVVVQDRVVETHVLAVAFDVTVTTDRGRIEATMVVRPVARHG